MVRTRRAITTGEASHRPTRRAIAFANKSNTKPSRAKPNPRPKFAVIDEQRFPVSPVLDTLFYFMAERHRIFLRRTSGEERPWTDDEILQKYPFTNVFRVYDRTTQYVLRHVVNQGSQDLHESCFRVILFRMFNKIETWKHLKQQIGELTWADFDVHTYEKVLGAVSGPLYGPAYICPAPNNIGGKFNYARHLRLVQLLMEENLPKQLKRFRYLKDAHGWLLLFPSMGDFTALQYVAPRVYVCIELTYLQAHIRPEHASALQME
ncbi:hypothetical protein EVJ58_g3497 [Rhodofomes roseus]|uniref:5-hmdU DNA kinase helical domain-containing protein n=1 Tax=Rhodofomes roseus TaxID=34475 RepID=A0A4Y9YM34_9APHY|nr:hypothetical protein EVJ58_g3497 [Rhodofomes roseus]